MRGKTFHIEVNKSDTIADLNILLLANENKNAASVGTKKRHHVTSSFQLIF